MPPAELFAFGLWLPWVLFATTLDRLAPVLGATYLTTADARKGGGYITLRHRVGGWVADPLTARGLT